MSNRLTFSLASLILIFALAFVAMPAMAADGGPTVTITPYTGKNTDTPAVDHVQTRSDFRVKVTFSHFVTDLVATNVTLQTAASRTSLLSTVTSGTPVTVLSAASPGSGATGVPATELTANKVYVLILDLGDTDYAAGYMAVNIAADQVTGAEAAVVGLGNQPGSFDSSSLPKFTDWTITASIGTDKPEITGDKLDGGDGTNPGTDTFDVDFTYSGGTDTLPPIPANQIQVKDAATGTTIAATVIQAPSGATSPTGIVATAQFTVVATAAAVDAVTIGVNPNWANAVPMGGLRIPEAAAPTPPAKTAVDPVVDISPVGTINTSAMTFEVKFTFAEATVDAATQTAVAVPTAADFTADKITIQKEDASGALIDSLAYVEPTGGIIALPGGNFLVTINYRLDALPLFVGTSIGVSETTIEGTAPSSGDPMALMVGSSGPGTPPGPSPNAPGAPQNLTATADQATNTIELEWDAPASDGGSAITKYEITKTYTPTGSTTMATVMIDAGTNTSFTLPKPGEAALPQGVTFTFTVTAENANGVGPASGQATAMIDIDPSVPLSQPRFDRGPIGDIIWWVDEVNHTSPNMPLASDLQQFPIDPEGYSTDPSLPPGLDIHTTSDNQNRIIAGTPTVAQAKTSYKWIYTAPDGADVESPFTITIVERIAPGKVLGLTAVQDSHDPAAESVSLMWDALDVRVKTDANNNGNDGGSPVTHYMIMWTGPSNGTISTASEDDPDATSYTLEQDLPIGEYTFKVRAVNAIGMGAYSDTVTVNVANPPAAPRDLRAAIDQVTNRVTLNWLVPNSDGGDPIIGYVIYITEPDATVRTIELGLTTIHRTDTLTKEGQYVFRVAAVNGCGVGPKSNAQPLAAVILANKPPVFTAGSAIEDITATVGTAFTSRNALPIATDPEGEKIYYTISPTLPMGVNFNETSRVLSGTPTSAMGQTLYTYTAWDGNPDDPAVTDLTSASLQFSITVHPYKPLTINIPTATSSSAPIPLGPQFANTTTMIPAYGFAVLVRDVNDSGTYDPLPNTWLRSMDTALPDLAWFFGGTGGTNGGTIALNGPATAKDLLISEIMWGTDSSLAVPERSQWIEFYNATPNPIDLTGFTITFHRSQVPAAAWAGAVDVVSNAGRIYFGHSEFPGQSGRTDPVDTQGRYAATQNLISMFRDIDHVWVQHHNVGNRGERNKRIGGWLEALYPTANIHSGRVATPGAEQIRRVTIANTTMSRDVIINEIGNSANDDYDWIELHNTTAAAIKLRKWDFTMIVKEGEVGKEKRIFQFPDNDSVWVPANGYLVIARSHPRNDGNDLAAGIDVTKAAIDQLKRGLGEKDLANHPTAYYYVNSGLVLPNDTTRRLFVLRNANDKHGQPSHVIDATGTLSIEVRGDLPNGFTGYAPHTRQLWNTATWPFQGAGGVDGNVVKNGDEDFRAGKVYQRNSTPANGKESIEIRGYTGVGYDRHAAVNAENGGTPGYSKDAVKGDKSNWANQVSISEIMLVTEEGEGSGRVPRATRLPQWFEIYNASLTEAVSINNWYLEIQNDDTPDFLTNLHGTLRLPNVIIQPNQTVLVVSSSGLHSQNFPEQRTINVFTNSTYRQILGITRRGEPMLNPAGFYIELRDHKNNSVDEIGNLGVSRRTGTGRRDNFGEQWEMPSLHSEDGHRTSLIRIYDNGVPRSGLNEVGGPKNADTSWVLASNTNFRNVPSLTYYGNHRDFGTPGYRGGGPLPVSLSKFRPERLESGDVVIRWVTQSELNNAGFNILRSDTRDGQYTKVNTQLIAGQGTTSEKTSYEWKDTTAKPNVVYYYQIQDVSIDGKIQTLRVSRLKGNVTAAGKATTTWGELKALQ